jgi:raffinose/stachyose/melibiose transport system substrate-binding protein
MHMNRRTALAIAVGTALLIAGCTGTGGTSKGADANAPDDPSKVSGTIHVLTQRTDLVQDGTMKKYAAAFNKTYPKVKVEFEALTNYEAEVKIRMNTKNYGDVLLIPGVIKKSDYPKFFASLGTQAERAKKYRFTDFTTVNGKVYGQSPIGVTPGFVYNKKVWKAAGITQWPTTPAEFIADLKAIKSKTDATPYYTNFAAQWPLTSWTFVNGSVHCDTQATTKLADGDPWAKGADLRVGDTLLYDTVHDGLAEKDPTTTNWEASKARLAKGRSPRSGSAPGRSSSSRTRRHRPAWTRTTSASCPSRPKWTESSARLWAPTTTRPSTPTPPTRRRPAPGSTGSPTSPATTRTTWPSPR